MKFLLVLFFLISGSAFTQNDKCLDEKLRDSIVEMYNQAHKNVQSRSISNTVKNKQEEILRTMEQDTPCYAQIKFLLSEFDLNLYPQFKASLNDNSSSLLLKLDIGASIINRDNKNGIRQFEKLLKRNEYTQSTLQFYRNLLSSVPNKGYLITHSFEDTYCLWYIQQKENVRKDIQLVSLQLLTSKQYRKRIPLELSANKNVDVNFFDALLKKNSAKNISISSTVPKEYLRKHTKRLFPIGLVFAYAKQDFNYFENNDLFNEFMPTIEQLILNKNKRALNYIPMLRVKATVHKRQGEETDVVRVNNLIARIKKACS